METLPRCEFDADNLDLRAEIVFPGRIEGIAPIIERLMEMVEVMRCAQGKEFEIEIALREALV
jgi:hypothetical protein